MCTIGEYAKYRLNDLSWQTYCDLSKWWANDEQMMINVKCTDDDNDNAGAANDAADDDV